MVICASNPTGKDCQTPQSFPIILLSPEDLELKPNPSPASTTQKPLFGGLSCLFATSPDVNSANDDLLVLGCTHDAENIGEVTHCCSPVITVDDQSPVSVLRGPFSLVSLSPGNGNSGYLKLFELDGNGGFNGSCVGNGVAKCSTLVHTDTRRHSSRGVGACNFEREGDFKEETNQLGDMEDQGSEFPFDPILYSAQMTHIIFKEELIVRAFCEVKKAAHRGQVHGGIHSCLQNCMETAKVLTTVGSTSTVVAAGMLHHMLDETFVGYDYIFNIFGKEVADLVEGVSRLTRVSKLALQNCTLSETVQADRLRAMLLRMVDVRVVLIELAYRLHGMIALATSPFSEQQRFAKETLEIFSPLAGYLGFCNWKTLLEDLCFKYLNPLEYYDLSTQLVGSLGERKLIAAMEKLEQALKKEEVFYHVLSGRSKSLYSIYSKMLKKKLRVDEIHDIQGLRLIVDTDEDCFAALDVIHRLWREVPRKRKDYITCPKLNGYRSLHSVILGDDMIPMEVQIRSSEMHAEAELGSAAHWRYKEANSKPSSFILDMIERARTELTMYCNTDASLAFSLIKMVYPCPEEKQYLSSYHQEDLILVGIVEDGKMSIGVLPAQSTVMDLLERNNHGSSSHIYKEGLEVSLNGQILVGPNSSCLRMGDVVELMPSVKGKTLV